MNYNVQEAEFEINRLGRKGGWNDMSEMPKWLPEALACAQVADKLALSMEEVGWLRDHLKSGKGPYHWRVILLYTKSNFNLWKRKVKATTEGKVKS